MHDYHERQEAGSNSMKPNLKKLLSVLFIVISVSVVLFIAIGNPELTDIGTAFSQMNLWWVAGVFLCWVAYTVFDGLNYWCYLRRSGFKISVGRAINVALIGFYYSNITPSAAGGQPMQVNSMRKAGIPVGYGTMAVTIRFITNQFMISALSLGLFLYNRQFVYERLQGAMWIVRFGWLLNFAAVPLVIFAAFKRNLIQKIVNGLIRMLARIKLVKKPDATIEKVSGILDTYDKALHDLMHMPGQILLQFGCSFLSLLGLTGSIVFVYYAFGMQHVTHVPWHQVLTLSSLLYVSASATPLPGASGANEGFFMLFFTNVFTENIKGLALLVWRFFTYYLFLIVGVGTVILEKIILKREKRKQKKEQDEPAPEETEQGEPSPEKKEQDEPAPDIRE